MNTLCKGIYRMHLSKWVNTLTILEWAREWERDSNNFHDEVYKFIRKYQK